MPILFLEFRDLEFKIQICRDNQINYLGHSKISYYDISVSVYLSVLPMKQSTLHELSYLMFTIAPRSSCFDYLHFIYKKTKI